MIVGVLALGVVGILTATALMNRRTRRQISGDTALAAEASLRHDGGGDRGTHAEVGRQELRHVVERGMHGHTG